MLARLHRTGRRLPTLVTPLRLAQDTTTEYNGAVTDIPDNVDLQC
jgi:hypothetical protein